MSDKASLKRYNGLDFTEVYPKTTHDQIIASGSPSNTTFLRGDGVWATPISGTGNVVGPASSVDNRIAVFNGTTGKLIQDSGTLISNLATSTHTHNTLLSNGGFSGSPSAIASGDRLVIVDASNSSRIDHATLTFGTSQLSFLANDGTFRQPNFGAYSSSTTNTNTTTDHTQIFAITNITPGHYQFIMQGGWRRSSGGTARRFRGGLRWNDTSGIHLSLTTILQFGASSTVPIFGSMNFVSTFPLSNAFITDESTAFASGRFTVQGMIRILGGGTKTLFFDIGQSVAQTSVTCAVFSPSISLIRVL